MKQLDPIARATLIEEICQGLAMGAGIGETIRRLRVEVLGVDQGTFAELCKMSTRALYEIESDKGNPRLDTLLRVIRPFGLGIHFGPSKPTWLPRGTIPIAGTMTIPKPRYEALEKSKATRRAPKRGKNPKLVRAKAAAAAKQKQDSGTAE
ncbi:DNA-binding XRE family transcriptional regulator [Pseudomonas nitritireducens]|uniref:DNA-binding XRE family transcriptional regulator n=1 Tax=Pseudomonas nitroreducens TaxID=46680 RepID=A0A7W7KGK6_PSENT|nr:helix-turn-helix transcriptional regulator [Pseudomonas nitritireducens]MBB4861708.1 DNA-binding XRE family transcriptional regulator [Pseudomonas nitritireducens]